MRIIVAFTVNGLTYLFQLHVDLSLSVDRTFNQVTKTKTNQKQQYSKERRGDGSLRGPTYSRSIHSDTMEAQASHAEDITWTDRYACCTLGGARESYCAAHSSQPSEQLNEVAHATETDLKMGFMLCMCYIKIIPPCVLYSYIVRFSSR